MKGDSEDRDRRQGEALSAGEAAGAAEGRAEATDPGLPAGDFVAGFVSLLGAPNVGKSTLLNQILGDKVAIVTPKPQTTRDRILGVRTEARGQMVLLDTPGVHERARSLNAYMVRQAFAALEDADVAVLVVDAPAALAAGERPEAAAARDRAEARIAEQAQAQRTPLVVALNKVDRVVHKPNLLPLIARWADRAEAVVPLCALDGDGVEALLEEVWARLPAGPALFDGDALTDRSLRWLCGETIREQVFLQTQQEVPYAAAVAVERFLERDDQGDVVIEAVVFVERDSQKAIVVGRGGQRIKQIGTAARKEIGRLLGRPVHLKLRVAVARGWTESDEGIRKMGYEP